MKLRNKKSGEIIEAVIVDHGAEWEIRNMYSNEDTKTYNSLAELNAEWEDAPEEPKYFYCISIDGSINNYEIESYAHESWCKNGAKIIGNYFETKEEAEKAVEKLKAWKRLKDNGFKFTDDLVYGEYYGCGSIRFIIYPPKKNEAVINDLKLLFGGEQ